MAVDSQGVKLCRRSAQTAQPPVARESTDQARPATVGEADTAGADVRPERSGLPGIAAR